MTNTLSRKTLNRLLAMVLTIAMLMSFAVPVMATDEYPVPYPDLKVTHTATGGYEWGALNAERTEWGVTVYGRNTGSYQPIIKFTNTSSEKKTLSFNLSAVFGDGASSAYVQVATGTSGGTTILKKTSSFDNEYVEQELAANGVIRVVAKSSTGTTVPLTVMLTNLRLVSDTLAKTTFTVPLNGSYTVDGVQITEEIELEKEASEGYSVVATPNEGFQFYGWYEGNTDRIISTVLNFD